MSFRSLVLLLAVVGVAAMASRPAFDTDTWWHLRAGQWIVNQRSAPTLDPFSFTMRGAPWEYPGWLSQVVMLGFYRVGGLQGLTLFSAALVFVAFLFLWPLLQGPILLRTTVLLLSAAASAVYWAARPHIASFALAAFFFWALEMWRRGRRRRIVWLLPPVMALWVNLHGGFAIGFLLLIMYAGAALIDLGTEVILRGRPFPVVWAERRADLGTLAGVMVLCVAATAVNPHGPGILLYPLRTVSIPVLGWILEWQPPDPSSPQLYPFLMMLVLLITALGASRLAAETTEILLAAAWTALALIAVRNVPIFALVSAPVIARHTTAAIEAYSAAFGTSERQERRWLNASMGGLLGLVLVAWIALQADPRRSEEQLRAQVPVAAVAALRQLGPRGNLLNDYNWGGFVLWELYPDFPTFIDGRTDLFSREVFEDYLTMWATRAGWEAAIDRWDIGTVLLPPDSPLTDALWEVGWEEAFRDRQAVVLRRVGAQ